VKTTRRIFLTAGICWIFAVGACTKSPTEGLTAAQRKELETLTGQLTEPARSAKTKQEAAELLLTRSYPQAVEAVRAFLTDSSNTQAQIAIAKVLARRGGGPKAFVEPLMKMLTGQEASVRPAAAKALATYRNNGVTWDLISITLDGHMDKAVRLVTISSLQHVLDKGAVDALVRLLDDGDADIRNAAADTLGELTNIRSFGRNAGQWKLWWADNKHKDRNEWLADLAESLARASASLESQNTRLRRRLAAAMTDLYAATPTARQDDMLMSFLKDPLADVRLVGVRLAQRRLSGAGKLPQQMRLQIRVMLADADQRIRGPAALLVANLGDGQAVSALLTRLKNEQAPTVRQALLTALGKLQDAESTPAILVEIDSEDAGVSAAAAAALARIAEKNPPAGDVLAEAVDKLLKQYATSSRAPDREQFATLREALLTAMGAVADKQFLPALRGALKDPAATIRLAAVNGLAKLGQAGSADDIEPLLADADRGVRQAAIAALAKVGGPSTGQAGRKYLYSILNRTNPKAESDAAVRQEAWGAVMQICAEADAKLLADVCESLAGQEDATAHRIKLLGMLVASLAGAKDKKLPDAQRRLGKALLAAGRPAEAAGHLAEAYKTLAAAKAPRAIEVWTELISALIAADDPAVAKQMAGQEDDQAFATALDRLQERLAQLNKDENWAVIVSLTKEALNRLPHRLTVEQRKKLQDSLAAAQKRQLADDRQRVGKLVPQLRASEESARKAAAAQLQDMGTRAVMPLLEKLKKTVAAAQPEPDLEKAILTVLRQIAPKLTDYDPAAPRDHRIKRIESWIKESK